MKTFNTETEYVGFFFNFNVTLRLVDVSMIQITVFVPDQIKLQRFFAINSVLYPRLIRSS